MVTPVVYSRLAREDMLDLWIWIAGKSGVPMADTVLQRIETRLARLADFPQMGPSRSDIADGARMLVVERWLALYEFTDETIRIVRIIDGAMDLRDIEWSDEAN